MADQPITLEEALDDREVVLSDGSGLDLKFSILPINRSRKHRLVERLAELNDATQKRASAKSRTIDPELEEAQMQALCNVIDVVLDTASRPGSDEPILPGVMLFERWKSDDVTEDAIANLVDVLVGENGQGGQVADPT